MPPPFLRLSPNCRLPRSLRMQKSASRTSMASMRFKNKDHTDVIGYANQVLQRKPNHDYAKTLRDDAKRLRESAWEGRVLIRDAIAR